MINNSARKSAPEVKDGQVRKKNNWELTPNYYNTPQRYPVVDRQRPGKGYRHILKKKDIYTFIDILPDWEELSRGLNAVVLAPGLPYSYGYHVPGVIHIRGWAADYWIDCSAEYYERDQYFFDRLNVPCERLADGYLCKFTESAARAYQLLNIFLHELGHHRDLMTTRSQMQISRGEGFADRYAEVNSAYIWQRYMERFDFY
jgi:hypothetical protein